MKKINEKIKKALEAAGAKVTVKQFLLPNLVSNAESLTEM